MLNLLVILQWTDIINMYTLQDDQVDQHDAPQKDAQLTLLYFKNFCTVIA